MSEPELTLAPGREKSLRRRHPWIFSGAVGRLAGRAEAGDVVIVRSADGQFLAKAAFNPASQIVGRVWSFEEEPVIDEELVRGRVRRAIAGRAGLRDHTNACRLVYSEADGLPGLIADRYASFVVCQFSSAAVERFRSAIIDELSILPGVTCVYERADSKMRRREGLAPSLGVKWGELSGTTVEMTEGPWRFAVDVAKGHKTGFYLDQRDNRRAVAALSRSGARVLNLFCYTGAFSVAAFSGGASEVISVDSSRPALDGAAVNLAANGYDSGTLVEADAFEELRRMRDGRERFDLVIIDPPKLAQNDAQVSRATRAYKDLNWLAFRLLVPGGHLVTFSCSGSVSEDLFQKVVAGAAVDAGKDAFIEQRLRQPTDHPVSIHFPEGAYLKGLVLRVA